MFRNNHVKVDTWREKLEYVKTARAHFAENVELMDAYNKKMIAESIQQNRDAWRQEIYEGASGELFGAVETYQAAGQRVKDARRAESKRWNVSRLADEMKLAQQEVHGIIELSNIAGFGADDSPVERLHELYQEAIEAGEAHKTRGALEIIRASAAGLLASGRFHGDDRSALNRLSKQADQDLRQLRRTPEVEQAESGAAEALRGLQDKLSEFEAVGDLVENTSVGGGFSTGVFAKTLRRVQLDRFGNLTILEESHPDVTGVVFRGEEKHEQ